MVLACAAMAGVTAPVVAPCSPAVRTAGRPRAARAALQLGTNQLPRHKLHGCANYRRAETKALGSAQAMAEEEPAFLDSHQDVERSLRIQQLPLSSERLPDLHAAKEVRQGGDGFAQEGSLSTRGSGVPSVEGDSKEDYYRRAQEMWQVGTAVIQQAKVSQIPGGGRGGGAAGPGEDSSGAQEREAEKKETEAEMAEAHEAELGHFSMSGAEQKARAAEAEYAGVEERLEADQEKRAADAAGEGFGPPGSMAPERKAVKLASPSVKGQSGAVNEEAQVEEEERKAESKETTASDAQRTGPSYGAQEEEAEARIEEREAKLAGEWDGDAAKERGSAVGQAGARGSDGGMVEGLAAESAVESPEMLYQTASEDAKMTGGRQSAEGLESQATQLSRASMRPAEKEEEDEAEDIAATVIASEGAVEGTKEVAEVAASEAESIAAEFEDSADKVASDLRKKAGFQYPTNMNGAGDKDVVMEQAGDLAGDVGQAAVKAADKLEEAVSNILSPQKKQ